MKFASLYNYHFKVDDVTALSEDKSLKHFLTIE